MLFRSLVFHAGFCDPERELLKLNIDAGGVQSRRVIERLLSQEQEVAHD